MSMSLSTGGFSIIPPVALLTSWVAIMTDLLAVVSCRSRTASFARPGGLEVSFLGQFHARSRMTVSVYRYLSRLLSCFAVSGFFTTPKPCRESTQIVWISYAFCYADAPTLLRRSGYAGSLVPGSIRC
jgi:hypothetical protein